MASLALTVIVVSMSLLCGRGFCTTVHVVDCRLKLVKQKRKKKEQIPGTQDTATASRAPVVTH
jgi:hypothetical protein